MPVEGAVETLSAMDEKPHDTWASEALARLLYDALREVNFELARWALQLGRER